MPANRPVYTPVDDELLVWRPYMRAQSHGYGRTILIEEGTWGPRDAPTGRASDLVTCPGCGQTFAEGDYTFLVPIGPGDDEKQRENCRSGRFFNCLAIEVHLACVTGKEQP